MRSTLGRPVQRPRPVDKIARVIGLVRRHGVSLQARPTLWDIAKAVTIFHQHLSAITEFGGMGIALVKQPRLRVDPGFMRFVVVTFTVDGRLALRPVPSG